MGGSLSPPYLGHEVCIGSGLCPQVLGFGDVEEDVHDVSGDVEGEGDLGAAVALGSVLVRLPLHLCLGDIFVMAFPRERPFPHLFIHRVPLLLFLFLRCLHWQWGVEAALVQDGIFFWVALLGFSEGRVEAAEDGGGVVEVESPAGLGGTDEGEEEQQPGVGHCGGLPSGKSKGRAEMGMSFPRGPGQSFVVPPSSHIPWTWVDLPGSPQVLSNG